jgi:two-component system chemotaxis response regulator CheB
MKYRVLVVDDSVVVRRLVKESLQGDPDIEVVGVAANGRIGLAMVEQHSPDAITLDFEMPEMDGLQTLRQLRSRGFSTPVIMFSTLTERGALATLDALAAGADDYVTKPSNVGNVIESIRRISAELIPKIKALCYRSHAGRPAAPSTQQSEPQGRYSTPGLPPPPVVKPLRQDSGKLSVQLPARLATIEIVAIGTSTGGPNALADVIPHIPRNFPVPIVIVQHMPPTFTRFLAERLSASSFIPVSEGRTGQVLEPGAAVIAPGDYHMTLRREGTVVRVGVPQTPPENSCRPSVDVLFRSVAQVFGPSVLAVVMTGMGQDGLRGCEQVKEANGQVVVQDEESSVVWGMPGFVAKAGLADRVLPLAEIAEEIIRRVSAGRRQAQAEAGLKHAAV